MTALERYIAEMKKLGATEEDARTSWQLAARCRALAGAEPEPQPDPEPRPGGPAPGEVKATTFGEAWEIKVGSMAALLETVEPVERQYGPACELKALGGHVVGGHLLVYGSPEETDASRYKDYFDPSTRLGRFAKGPIDVLIDHGLSRDVGDVVIGTATMEPDAIGLAIRAELDTTIPEGRAALADVKAGRLRAWSSGAVGHRCRREAKTNARGETVHRVTSWALAEASLTASPCESRARAELKAQSAPERRRTIEDDLRQLERDIREMDIRDAERKAAALFYGRALCPVGLVCPPSGR